MKRKNLYKAIFGGGWVLKGVVVFVALSALLILSGGVALSAAPDEGEEKETPTLVMIDPDMVTLSPGELVTVTIRVDDVVDLFGMQYKLQFNPDLLEVWDVATDSPASEIVEGDVFDGRQYLVAANTVDNATGVVRFGASIYDDDPVSGPATFGQLTFRAKAEGLGILYFTEIGSSGRTSMTRRGAALIPAIWSSTYFAIGVEPQRVFMPIVFETIVE